MTYAFGGPEEYHGKDMFRAHERLVREKGMNDHHFDVIVKHLVAALKAFNVPEASHHCWQLSLFLAVFFRYFAIRLLASCPRSFFIGEVWEVTVWEGWGCWLG